MIVKDCHRSGSNRYYCCNWIGRMRFDCFEEFLFFWHQDMYITSSKFLHGRVWKLVIDCYCYYTVIYPQFSAILMGKIWGSKAWNLWLSPLVLGISWLCIPLSDESRLNSSPHPWFVDLWISSFRGPPNYRYYRVPSIQYEGIIHFSKTNHRWLIS